MSYSWVLCGLFLSAISAFAQTTRISGVSEPPELAGEPKKTAKPSEADEQIFEIMGHLGVDNAEARATLPKLDEFIKRHPDYTDGNFLRATFNACVSNDHDFDSITDDVSAAIAHPGKVYNTADFYSMLGKVAFAKSNYAQAVSDLERAMMGEPDTANRIFNIEGVEPARTSKFCVWNLSDLDVLATKFPRDYRVWLFRGLYYEFFTTFKEDYYPKAMKEFRQAALLNPKSPLPQYFIGQVYSKASFWTKKAWASDQGREDQFRNAAQAYTNAIRLDAKFLPAYEERASDYLNLKLYPQALKDYEKILELDPENSTALSDRGLALFETGRYLAAISDFGDAIRHKKDGDRYLTDLYEHRADAYVKMGEFRDAINDYSKAIEQRFGQMTILLSLKQIRSLYPEYDHVSDDALRHKIHDLFWPNMEYEGFAKKLEENGSWSISLVNELYEKRGDAYLMAGDFRRGVFDFNRIFKGIPDFADSTDRWRSLGKTPDGEYFLDVKTAEFAADEPARLWIKTVKKKEAQTVAYEMDCKEKRINGVSAVTYDATGKVMSSSEESSGWQRVIPDSLGEQLLNGACSPAH